jgi:hypothetical protein
MSPRDLGGSPPSAAKPREHAGSVALGAKGSPSESLGSAQIAWPSRLKALLQRA